MTYFARIFLLSIMFITSISYAHTPQALTANLTKQQAELRSKQISNTAYQLTLWLQQAATTYQGIVTIEFDYHKVGQALQIDFFKGKIHSVNVNGQKDTSFTYNQINIQIPEKRLNSGKNKITIAYEHEFSKTGTGLYRFVDPVDQRVYIYSNFEPFDANLMFPSFDQPDLKATFDLTVHAPKNWIVVSTSTEKSVHLDHGKSQKIWQFAQTPRLSTYVFSMHAGDYQVWQDNSSDIPMRLLARHSLAPYVNYKEWFALTKAGLQYFNQYFAYPYPFKKYDQLLVPDFDSGAMENVAAVTFDENYIPKSELSDLEKLQLIEVIYHEMAHMWFGNLVTMKWWNDLWLNESFATYMSFLAMEHIVPNTKPWLAFYLHMKSDAYIADYRETTHPILASVNSIQDAITTFDAITYFKGAAVLKQLAFFIGAEKFKTAMQAYMKKYAYQNTQLHDFLFVLGNHSIGHDSVKTFADKWLATTGFNTITTTPHCQQQQFDLQQSNKPLRPHKALVSLFKKQGDKLTVLQTRTVQYQNAIQAETMASKECPDFIFANQDDYDYAMLHLTQAQYDFLLANLSQFNQALSRAVLLDSLFWPVLQGEKSLAPAWQISLAMIRSEPELLLVEKSLAYISKMAAYLPNETPAQQLIFQARIKQVTDAIWQRLHSETLASSMKKILVNYYIALASTSQNQQILQDLLAEKQKIAGWQLDQNQRWQIIIRLNSLNAANSRDLISSELKRDPSYEGENSALTAQAALPDLAVKKTWLHKILTDQTMTLAQKTAVTSGLFSLGQRALKAKMMDEIYKTYLTLNRSGNETLLKRFIDYVGFDLPLCTEENAAYLKQFIQTTPNLSPTAVVALKEHYDQEIRCLGIQKYLKPAN